MSKLSSATKELERRALKAAMRVSECWPDDLSYFKGHGGALLKMLRACKRLKNARKP